MIKNVGASFVTFVKLMPFMFIFNSLISEKFSYFNTESRYEDVRPTSSTYEQIIETDDQYTSLEGPESLQDDDGEYLQPVTTHSNGAEHGGTVIQDGVSFF